MIKNYKHKKASLSSSVSRRGSMETMGQKGFMMIKNKQSKQLPFLKKRVYVKDTLDHRLPHLREDKNDNCDGIKNTSYSKMYPLFPFVFLLALSGCMGVYEGGFECPAGVGVGCKSISDVNNLVNQGEIPKIPSEQLDSEKLEIWYAPQGSAQYSVISYQKNSLLNSGQTHSSTKEKRKGARSLDPKSI